MHFEHIEARSASAGVECHKLDSKDCKLVPKEEAARLTAACPWFTFAVKGVERDGKPFDVLKRVRAPFVETAEGILRVQAAICYGARLNSVLLVKTEQPE